MLHAVVMAGGSGTRFWPQSRRALPKQFLRVQGTRTLIQDAVDRVAGTVPPDRTWVVTNQALVDVTRSQLPELPPGHVLGEPCARNTAPCVALAAGRLLADDPQATMLVLPADHVISPHEKFASAVAQAAAIVERSPTTLVLFGVRPTGPATGYGYIERGSDPIAGSATGFRVASFREKPDVETASEYVARGTFLWNCGIFLWRADRILAELAAFEPTIASGLERVNLSWKTAEAPRLLAQDFPRLPSISIDYAVLERSKDVAVIEAPFAWDDVGSWQAVARLAGSDADGQTIDGPYCGIGSQGCIVRTTPDHLVATLGVRDLIVVHTPDATLVADRKDENAVKDLVAKLAAEGREQWL